MCFGKKLILILAVLVIFMSSCSDDEQRYKIACSGDSITFGFNLFLRFSQCYPSVLQKLVGDEYQVKNFGVSGSCVNPDGLEPYELSSGYSRTVKFQPDLLILQLGTNDSKVESWVDRSSFVGFYNRLLDRLVAELNGVKIVLVIPPPLFENNWDLNASIISDFIVPAVREIAAARSLPVVDLFNLFKRRSRNFPDGVHPDADGAELIAREVYSILKKKSGLLIQY